MPTNSQLVINLYRARSRQSRCQYPAASTLLPVPCCQYPAATEVSLPLQAEQARQQAEEELLAMCEGDVAQPKKKKKSPKKKKAAAANSSSKEGSGPDAKGSLVVVMNEVKEVEAALDFAAAEGEEASVCSEEASSRDAANALLGQAIEQVSSRQPSKHGMACLEAALAQATSADQELIAQATQQRKAIRGKLKKLRNKDHRLARAYEALEGAMASHTCVEQLADAIVNVESLVSDTSGDAAVALAKMRLADTHIELHRSRRAAQAALVAALDPAEQRVENHTAEAITEHQQRQDDSTMCVVCISRPKTVLLLPCRHLCVCLECCDSILQVESLCPLCRVGIDSHLEAFM